MKKKKVIGSIAVITIAATIVGIYEYNTEYSKEDNEIKVMDYKSPEVINEKGYEISKCKADNIKQWVDKDKVITLRRDLDDKENYAVHAGYISMYDLGTKTYKDYKNSVVYENVSKWQGYGSSSPGGKYVLYAEANKIPNHDSEDYKNRLQFKEEESKHIKMNILDLSTGEIIEDFDKGHINYFGDYEWINDDYIFALVESNWRIIDKEGNVIKEGELDCKDDSSSMAFLMDISEIKVQDNDLVGSFYYQKSVRKSNTEVIEEVYSMDINTKEENLIGNYDNYMYVEKKGGIIVVGYYPNNDDVTTEYGFKLMDVSGREIQVCQEEKKRYGAVSLSDNGDKCAFLDYYGDKSGNEGLFDATLKIMDVNSGEIKEVTKLSNLVDGMDNKETMDLAYDIVWDSTGTSLAFSSSFRTIEDGETHKSSYIITFDK